MMKPSSTPNRRSASSAGSPRPAFGGSAAAVGTPKATTTTKFSGSVAASPITPRGGAARSSVASTTAPASAAGGGGGGASAATATTTAVAVGRTNSAASSVGGRLAALAIPVNTSRGLSPAGKSPLRGRSPSSANVTPTRTPLNASFGSVAQANAQSSVTRQRSGSNASNFGSTRPVSPRGRASTTVLQPNPAVITELEEKIKRLQEALEAQKATTAKVEEESKGREADLATKLRESQNAYNKMLGKQLLQQRQRVSDEKAQQENNRRLTHMNIALSREEDAIQKSIDGKGINKSETDAAAAAAIASVARRSNSMAIVNNANSASGGGGGGGAPSLATNNSNDISGAFRYSESFAAFGTNGTNSIGDTSGTNQAVILNAARESIELRRAKRELAQKTAALQKANETIATLESIKTSQKSEIDKARREALIAVREKEETQHQADRLRVEGNLRVGSVELELVEAQSKLVSFERQITNFQGQIFSLTSELKVAKSKLKVQTDADERQGTVRDQLLAASIGKAHADDTVERQRRQILDMNEVIQGLQEETQLLRLEVDKYRAASIKAGIILQPTAIAPTDMSKYNAQRGASAAATTQLQQQIQQFLGSSARNNTFLNVDSFDGAGSVRGHSPYVRSRSNSVMVQPNSGNSSPTVRGGGLEGLLNTRASFLIPPGGNLNGSISGGVGNAAGGSLGATQQQQQNTVAPLVYDPLANFQVTLADPTKNYLCVETNAAKRLFAMEKEALMTMLLEGFAAFEQLFNSHRAMLGTTADIVHRAVAEMSNELRNGSSGLTTLTSTQRNPSPTRTITSPTRQGPRAASPNGTVTSRHTSPISSHLVGSAVHMAGPSNRPRAHSPNSTTAPPSDGFGTPRGRTPSRTAGGQQQPAGTVGTPTSGTSYSGRIGQAPPPRGVASGSKTPVRRFGTPSRTTSAPPPPLPLPSSASDAAAPTTPRGTPRVPTATNLYANAAQSNNVILSPASPAFRNLKGVPPPSASAEAALGAPVTVSSFDRQAGSNRSYEAQKANAQQNESTLQSTPRPFSQSSTQPFALSPLPNSNTGDVPLSHHKQYPNSLAAATAATANVYEGQPLTPLAAPLSPNNAPLFVGTWYGTDGRDAVRAWLSLVNVFSPALENSLYHAGFTDMIGLSHITEHDLVRLSVTPGIRRKLMAAANELQRKIVLIREESEGILRRTYGISEQFAKDLAEAGELDSDDNDDSADDHDDARSDMSGLRGNRSGPPSASASVLQAQLTITDDHDNVVNDIVFEVPPLDGPTANATNTTTAPAPAPSTRRTSKGSGVHNGFKSASVPQPSPQSAADAAIRRAKRLNRKRRERMERSVAAKFLTIGKLGFMSSADSGAAADSSLLFASSNAAAVRNGTDPRAKMNSIFNEIHDWFADVRVAIQNQNESVERIFEQTSLQK